LTWNGLGVSAPSLFLKRGNMEIRHKMNKGVASIDDATGAKLVDNEHSVWERWVPKDAPEPKKPPVKKVPS
jgi:hypothetical protein